MVLSDVQQAVQGRERVQVSPHVRVPPEAAAPGRRDAGEVRRLVLARVRRQLS